MEPSSPELPADAEGAVVEARVNHDESIRDEVMTVMWWRRRRPASQSLRRRERRQRAASSRRPNREAEAQPMAQNSAEKRRPVGRFSGTPQL